MNDYLVINHGIDGYAVINNIHIISAQTPEDACKIAMATDGVYVEEWRKKTGFSAFKLDELKPGFKYYELVKNNI